MQNYKMTIKYDGTRYQGWQRQTNTDKSIQGRIEAVLTKMCGHNVEIHGSGRTDAGVHAIGQVASFKINTDKTCDEIKDYLNLYLPGDIAAVNVCPVDDRFHARLTASEKTYVYRINNTNISNVFERKYVYNLPEKLNVEKMREASEYLLGEHDFIGFSSVKKTKKSTVRTIYKVDITQGEEIKIFITGNGFLYNMVRIISGTLIEIGLGKKEISCIKDVLEYKDRRSAGFTAPAQGLTLYEVKYKKKQKGENIK